MTAPLQNLIEVSTSLQPVCLQHPSRQLLLFILAARSRKLEVRTDIFGKSCTYNHKPFEFGARVSIENQMLTTKPVWKPNTYPNFHLGTYKLTLFSFNVCSCELIKLAEFSWSVLTLGWGVPYSQFKLTGESFEVSIVWSFHRW